MMKAPWVFYASTKGHGLFIEVTTNNACNVGICPKLDGTVYMHVDRADEIGELFAEYAEYSEIGYGGLIDKAKELCALLERDFGLELVYGDEAWEERLKVPKQILENTWRTYLDRVGGKGDIPMDHKLIIINSWIDEWDRSDAHRKQDYVEFGFGKLMKVKWEAYLDEVNVKAGASLDKKIQTVETWIKDWEASDDPRKLDYIEFGKGKLIAIQS